MTLLERVIVSRKTPADGRLLISAASAARIEALGPTVALERGGERGSARLHTMTCTCNKGGGKGGAEGGGHGAHVHHFVESPLLTALAPGSEVALELDDRRDAETPTLRVAPV